jgi:hypothetical protein
MITRRLLLATASALMAVPAFAAPPPGKLYKNPQCECCEGYAAYLRQHDFTVTVVPTNDLAEIDRLAGIPEALEGCHTMFIGNYFVSGHVPIEAVRKLLADQPDIKGITLPGMPEGSPGMYGKKTAPFTIYAIAKDGKSSVYMTV